jgi:high affinity Mn2+ porin
MMQYGCRSVRRFPRSGRSAKPLRASLAVYGLFVVCVMIVPRAAIAQQSTAGAAGQAATQPAGQSPSDDLDAQERELLRQRLEIDQKLADIAARRKAAAAGSQPTSGSAPVEPAPSPAAEAAGIAAVPPPVATSPAWYNVHGQTTVITQKHDTFRSPYEGPRSLLRDEGIKTSVTATLFLGLHLPWHGGEVYFDPEVSGGEGLSGVNGIGDFSNGDISHVGMPEPEPYVARLFYKQTLDLGGPTEDLPEGPNQLPVTSDISRLTLVLGKFSIVDYFQQSAYANDPRSQFFGEALFTDGAWDYPADTRGYTEGAMVELNQANWALRYGAVAMPKNANGSTYDSRLPKALGQVLELEERYKLLFQRDGALKVMAFANGAHMGNYGEATEIGRLTGTTPDVTKDASFSYKWGFGLTLDQPLTDNLGSFLRLSWNDGHTETFAFTAIDRSLAVGLSLQGSSWGRTQDVVGLALVIDGLAHDHREYLAAGGLDFDIGDGRLPHYALEDVIEAYYRFKLNDNVYISPDFQLVDHPAYNADRGPVIIGGIRAHAEF